MQDTNVQEIQAVIASSDIVECVSELNSLVNLVECGVEINPLGIYCQKTGALIGQRDQNSLFSLHKICGKEAIVGNLYNATALAVHPAWLITTGGALDDLMENDPVNYCVYCFGLFTQQYYQKAISKDQRKQPFSERYWAMARANAMIMTRGIARIDELNLALQRALIYAPDTLQYIAKKVRAFAETPDNLAQLAISGELIDIVNDATDKITSSIGLANIYIERTRFVDVALSAADAARGPSNIRKQRRTKRDIAETQMMVELRELMGNIHFSEQKQPDYKAIRARLQQPQQEQTELESAYAAILPTNFDITIDDIEIGDENAVEINRIVAVQGEAERTPIIKQPQEPEPAPIDVSNIRNAINATLAQNSNTAQTTKPLTSLAARIAAMKAGKK